MLTCDVGDTLISTTLVPGGAESGRQPHWDPGRAQAHHRPAHPEPGPLGRGHAYSVRTLPGHRRLDFMKQGVYLHTLYGPTPSTIRK